MSLSVFCIIFLLSEVPLVFTYYALPGDANDALNCFGGSHLRPS